jgi:hypothetical protein
MIRKIEIEGFSLTTSKRFAEVVAGVNAAIGHPDMAEFARSSHEACSFRRQRHIPCPRGSSLVAVRNLDT